MTNQFPQPTCWVRRRTCQALDTVWRNKTEPNYTEVCNNNLVINSREADKMVDATMEGDKVVVDVTWREVKQSLTALRWRRTLRVFLSFSYLSHTPPVSTSAPSTEYNDRNLILCQSSDVLQIQLHAWAMSEADQRADQSLARQTRHQTWSMINHRLRLNLFDFPCHFATNAGGASNMMMGSFCNLLHFQYSPMQVGLGAMLGSTLLHLLTTQLIFSPTQELFSFMTKEFL